MEFSEPDGLRECDRPPCVGRAVSSDGNRGARSRGDARSAILEVVAGGASEAAGGTALGAVGVEREDIEGELISYLIMGCVCVVEMMMIGERKQAKNQRRKKEA